MTITTDESRRDTKVQAALDSLADMAIEWLDRGIDIHDPWLVQQRGQ